MKNCIICHSAGAKKIFIKNNFTIMRCDTCGLIFMDNDLSLSELKKYYEKSYYTGGNEYVYTDYIANQVSFETSFKNRLKKILKYKNTGNLLDIGCAAGFFLNVAKNNFNVTGIELSKYAAEFGKKKLKLNIKNCTLMEAKFPAGKFDIVTMWDVIEHLPDPKKELIEVNRVMKKHGYFVFSTANVASMESFIYKKNWIIFAPPWHLFYFSKKTIINLLNQCGFEIARFEYSGVPFVNENTPDKLISKILVKLFGNRISSKILSFLKIGFILTVYAKKIK